MFILEAIAAFGNWFWGLPILFPDRRRRYLHHDPFGIRAVQKVWIHMFADFRQDVFKGRKAKYLRFPQPAELCLIHRSLNIVGVPAAVVGRSRSSILDLAHSLNRLRNQVLRDRSGDQIQRKERSRRMGRRRSLLSESLRRRHRQVFGWMVRYRPDDRADPSLCTQALSATEQFIILALIRRYPE